MSAPPHDSSRLVALIAAAKSHADELGPEIRQIARLLDEALAAARRISARGGKPDEGLRPEELTTDNDGGMG